jgi:D-serine deaminase-like pyridoxal phosphate-dependent protein
MRGRGGTLNRRHFCPSRNSRFVIVGHARVIIAMTGPDIHVHDSVLAAKRINGCEAILTPALAIYPDAVDANIATTVRLLGGRPERWRPHVKTAKLASTMRQYMAHNIRQFKCATTLELVTLCEAGASDVLLAFPCVGFRANRIRAIALSYPNVRLSLIVENHWEVGMWRGSGIGMFIDVNPGMNRTGILQSRVEEILGLAKHIQAEGLGFAGLHYYDGHLRQPNRDERNVAAHSGYEQLIKLVQALRQEKIACPEVVTSGTPTLPCALSFPGFQTEEFMHRVSPGTVVYNDLASLSQLPAEWGFDLAALVLATVISHPAPGIITCDAGHKVVSVDSGLPNCAVVGHPDLEPLRPSEEHLPIRVCEGGFMPEIGEVLYLAPKHICPTVNNFDEALLIQEHEIVCVAPVSARGREAPLLDAAPRRP